LRGLLLAHRRLRRFLRGQWSFAEGDDAGGIFIVVGGIFQVYAQSIEDSLVIQADDAALSRIAAQQPLIWKAVASLHYMQLGGMIQMIAEFASLPPRQRLAARLVRFALGRDKQQILRLSQQDLGDMTGLSRKTVNACLADLQAKELIRRKYAAIEMVDLPG
jgi:CRP-like cAMP-binding protein